MTAGGAGGIDDDWNHVIDEVFFSVVEGFICVLIICFDLGLYIGFY